jgi:hypothetical protein
MSKQFAQVGQVKCLLFVSWNDRTLWYNQSCIWLQDKQIISNIFIDRGVVYD